MKKKLIPLFIVPVLLLSSCTLFTTSSVAGEVSVYNLDKLDETKNLESGYQKTVTARFVKNEPLIPYLTLEQYASLYDEHFAEGFTSTVEKSLYGSIWTVKYGDDPFFISSVDYLSREIIVSGTLTATFKPGDDPKDLRALNHGLKTTAEGKFIGDRPYTIYSYDGYGLRHFSSSGEYYLPLGLLDITYSENSSIYFTYAYEHIFSTHDVDNYQSLKFKKDGVEYTFDSEMKAHIPDNTNMPSYLAKYNAGLFLYTMDYFYGLKKDKNIRSMASYYCNLGSIYDDLTSRNNNDRVYAYCDALAVLDDNHTVLVSVNDTWSDGTYTTTRRYGQGCYNRSRTRVQLKGYRDQMYDNLSLVAGSDIIYSQDNKTAFFSFDSFSFGTSEQVFNADGSIKETAGQYDTFFKLIDVFNKVEQKGTVENIILDISLNGGGVVGIMIKLLALISKTNTCSLSMYTDTNSELAIYHGQVDSNNDSKYDENDCFGNKFNFYIMTSDCSFSCGNAFPCTAQREGNAKIIGQKSGGGECAVGIHYLPNSEYVYHSSNLHLGAYDADNNAFIGYENGATPDIEVAIDENFYSVEALNRAILNA